MQEIPVRQIVGTDSRGGDFDRDFVRLRPPIAARMRRVAQAFPNGDFPPIVVYRVGEAYFVVDGHHRVAIARQRGMETIDAEVLCVYQRRRDLFANRGGRSLEQVAREWTAEAQDRKRGSLRRLLRRRAE